MRAAIGNRSIEEIRADFPILERTLPVSGGGERPLVYLDSAATAQKPLQVIDAVTGYYRTSNANVHRGLHRLSEEATSAYERARRTVREFIGASSDREIVFTGGTTDSINLVAASWGRRNISEGDVILLTEMEHHSNLVPWQLLAAERGASLAFIPFDERGVLELKALPELMSDRVKIIALTHMSNVFGTVNDVKAVTDFAHEHGAVVLVDAAQSVPRIPVDVTRLGCDFLAFSGHKAYGPTGIGALYGREALLAEMQPYRGGGEMISAVWLDHATWNDLPYKFEAGTPNIAGAVGLRAALDYLTGLGMDSVMAYEEEITRYALEILSADDSVTIYGSAPERGGVISFNVGGIHAHDSAQLLDGEGIAVRAGHHCAHPLMRKLGVPSALRASFGIYTTRGEIELLAAGIEKVRSFFGNGF